MSFNRPVRIGNGRVRPPPTPKLDQQTNSASPWATSAASTSMPAPIRLVIDAISRIITGTIAGQHGRSRSSRPSHNHASNPPSARRGVVGADRDGPLIDELDLVVSFNVADLDRHSGLCSALA